MKDRYFGKTAVAPPVEEKKPVFECVSCDKAASVIFEGTTYCKPCLKESLRTGN